MRVASFNVNSIKARLPNLTAWLGEARPDVVLLQETKTVDGDFPFGPLQALGYHAAINGQKSYNGVAILARQEPQDVICGLPGDDSDVQARYIEASVGPLRVASIYLPNGNPVDTGKFAYKLRWMERLYAHARGLLDHEHLLVLGGDYNVAPTDGDVYDAAAFRDDALCRPESRRLFRSLLHLGFTDAFRAFTAEIGCYTFWDYQAGAWQRDNGLRIDHLLLSPQAADRLAACDIDRAPRGREKASDHTPIWCAIDVG